jgi:protein subunit release factor B
MILRHLFISRIFTVNTVRLRPLIPTTIPKPLSFPLSHSYSTTPDIDIDPNFANEFTSDHIPRDKLTIKFVRSGGPGGQNVNKVSTKVGMRFNLKDATEWLPPYVHRRLIEQNPNRVSKAYEFVLSSDRHRTQRQNLADCIDKLTDMIKKAAFVPQGPSEETLQRIEEIKEVAKEKKKFQKQKHSSKKADRQWKY